MGDNSVVAQLDPAALERLVRERVDAVLDERLEAKLAALQAGRTPSMTIIANQGHARLGVSALHPRVDRRRPRVERRGLLHLLWPGAPEEGPRALHVTPVGNPAMPMKMPFGPGWLRSIRWNIPNALQGIVPGFEAFATTMMKQTIRNKGVAAVAELRQACIEADVKLIGCQMTVDLFGYARDDFIPEVSEYVGAATFLPMAKDADVSLFI